MTIVFVHGNPETDAIWSELVGELADRGVDGVVLLTPPGFGAPVPDGWGATRSEYRDWLVRELESIVESSGPADVVGHDWGAGHVFGALAARPDLFRTWSTDCVGLLHPDYVWHDMALAWQAPEIGEQVVEAMRSADREENAAGMVALGMSRQAAEATVDAMDADMARCILGLYRSAAQPAMQELGEVLAGGALPPGLVLIPTADPYAGTTEMATHVADLMGADTSPLEGLGHWWMMERPDLAADALVAHWNS
ncbi:MAG: alpha/beta hydrolase [Acidimicrobiales bacterium]|jgi:pimeloyl-ACP methyl ester carboxylesterase|nr:alpha/beta hydrolase [Acidimicrobiales bacterium]